MAFDSTSARPEGNGGFDAGSARLLVAPESVNPLQAAAISAGHYVDKSAVGLRNAVPSGLARAIDALGERLGMAPPSTDQSLAASEKTIAPLEREHPVASFVGEAAPQLGMGPVGMGISAAVQPGTPMERLQHGLLALGLGKAGEFAGGKLAQAASSAGAAQKVLTPAEELLSRTQAAGLKVAPNEAGQQSALQWVGGQIKTQQTMASKNVPRATALAAADVGLPPQPITRSALQEVRDTAGQAYDVVASQGVLNWSPELSAGARALRNEYEQVTNTFKSLRSPETEALLADLDRPQFHAAGTIEAVKRFRSEGFANLASEKPADRALGRVQLRAQSLLENMMDENLAQRGMTDAVANLQQARKVIAQTYSIQNALDANGNVIVSKLSNQLTRGKPLSGNLELLAQAGAAYPKSMQHLTATPPAFSALDFATALLSGGAKEAAMLGARPMARAIAASKPYQAAFMQPNTQMAAPILSLLGASDVPAYAGSRLGLLGQGIGQ